LIDGMAVHVVMVGDKPTSYGVSRHTFKRGSVIVCFVPRNDPSQAQDRTLSTMEVLK
jgi:hypothetical protein